MSGTRLIEVTALAAAAVLAFTLATSAFAQPPAAQATRSSPSASAAGQTVTPLSQIKPTVKPTVLKPIEVKVYLPVALGMIKAALKRPESFANKDMDKLVCQRHTLFDSHLPALRCATNCQLWVRQQRTQLLMATGSSGAFSTQMCDGPDGSASPNPSAQYARARVIAALADQASARGRASTLLGLVAKLRSVGSSYTLLVHDHGKVVAEYVLKHGKLVKVVKLGKTEKHKQ